MPGDLLGFLLSAVLIFLCMGLAFLVAKNGKQKFNGHASEIARKIVHIGVSNWFFIYYFCFTSSLWAIVGLGAFALINFVLTVSGGFSVIMGKQSQERSWGVVYYPLSIIGLLVLQELGLGSRVDVGCAILGMGYGDGLAALAGLQWGKKKLYAGSKKTLVGSVTMLIVVSLTVLLLKSCFESFYWALILFSLLLGLASALFEAVTPFGLDNISVPVVIFLLAGLI